MPGINFDHPSSDISADSGTMTFDGAAAFTAVNGTKLDGIAKKGTDLPSGTPTVPVDGDYFDVTGSTTITAFVVAADRHFFTQFDVAIQLTHHATNLDLPGEANITTGVGDVAEWFSTGANTCQCVNYTKADGTAVVAAGGGIGKFISTSIAISSTDTALANDDGTANRNIGIGNGAGEGITSGADNIAIGNNAMQVGVGTGDGNVSIGQGAGNDLTSGPGNVLIGQRAGDEITSGTDNIAIGNTVMAGPPAKTGAYNICIGNLAGNVLAAGAENILIGRRTGLAIAGGGTNTVVGSESGKIITTGTNLTVLGNTAEPSAADATNEVTIGNTAIATTRVQVDWTVLSDERDKANVTPIADGSLNFINALTPVTFQLDDRTWYYDEETIIHPGEIHPEEIIKGETTLEMVDDKEVEVTALDEIIPEWQEEDTEEIIRHPKPRDGSKVAPIVRPGLTAQDVMAAAAIHGNGKFDDIVNSANPDRLEYIPSAILFPLIKAVQELSAEVTVLKTRLDAAGL